MSQETLLASALFSLASGTLYVYVGNRVQRRAVHPDVRLPSHGFAAWWYTLGAITILGGVHLAVAAFGRATLHSALLLSHVSVALICVGLWGLLFYLVYLYTGVLQVWVPLAFGYAVYYALLIYYITASEPTGIRIGNWSIETDYARQLGGPFFGLVVVLLLVPQILGALAYLLLYFRTKERTARYRIALIAVSIIVWFTIPLFGIVLGLNERDWWQGLSRVISLTAALAVLAAYQPPTWVQSRFGITPA